MFEFPFCVDVDISLPMASSHFYFSFCYVFSAGSLTVSMHVVYGMDGPFCPSFYRYDPSKCNYQTILHVCSWFAKNLISRYATVSFITNTTDYSPICPSIAYTPKEGKQDSTPTQNSMCQGVRVGKRPRSIRLSLGSDVPGSLMIHSWFIGR